MDLINKYYKMGTSIEPKVIIDEKDVEECVSIISKMHSFDKDLYYPEVIDRFSAIFGGLGIETNGSIYLDNMKTNPSRCGGLTTGSVSFNYHVEGEKDNNTNVITYYCIGELEYSCSSPFVKISSDNTSLYYFVEEYGYRPARYEVVLDDGTVLSCCFYKNSVGFVFEKEDSRFTIQVGGQPFMFCEDEVIEYLKKLSRPYDIFEIFNKLCEISLGFDMTSYSSIILSEEKKVKNAWFDVNYISIVDGNISSIVRTVGDKTICCDADGNWDYTMEDENVMLTINSGDTVRYSIEAKNTKMMDDYTDTLLRYDVTTARNEVEETKRLVREKTGIKK